MNERSQEEGQPATDAQRAQGLRWPAALSLCFAAVALAHFAWGTAQLVRYPWDWDPGEGLSLDYARRLLHAPATLYPLRAAVPYPLVYTPLLTVLLAPLVALSPAPLQAARLLGAGFALLAAGAAFSLGRRSGGAPFGWAAAALALAPVGSVFWFDLARTDGAMITLWLAAAAVSLPPRLVRGSGALSLPRALAAAALLVLAVLAKPPAMLLGAPLVLGWLLVDMRSALRLGGGALALGVLSFAGLQLATGGGFWRCLRLQLLHAMMPGQAGNLVTGWLLRDWPVAALALAALLLARREARRDGAWLLWLSGPLSLPLLGKSGANFVYLLPFTCATAVLAARLCAAAGRRLEHPALLACLASAVAAAVSLAQVFPLPTAEDALTAASLYGYVRARGAPILAANPDLAYVLVEQPVEIEGTSFPALARAREPGIDEVLASVRNSRYTLLIEKSRAGRIVADNYVPTGACDLGYFLGTIRFTLLVPRAAEAGARFTPLPGARCTARQASATPGSSAP